MTSNPNLDEFIDSPRSLSQLSSRKPSRDSDLDSAFTKNGTGIQRKSSKGKRIVCLFVSLWDRPEALSFRGMKVVLLQQHFAKPPFSIAILKSRACLLLTCAPIIKC